MVKERGIRPTDEEEREGEVDVEEEPEEEDERTEAGLRWDMPGEDMHRAIKRGGAKKIA